MKKSYELWQGRKVRDWKGEVFIATTDKEWASRLAEWKKEHFDDPDCPCPMPLGHLMFRNRKDSPYTVVE